MEKRSLVSLVFAGALLTLGCTKEESESSQSEPAGVVVLRVESLSPESPGAEHCSAEGKDCKPLAPQQKLKPEGLVRTFAGGRVSLDFGGGRRVDLDSLSETVLSQDQVKLQRGVFSLDSTPLVQKEKFEPLKFEAGGKVLSSSRDLPTTTALAVNEDETLLTVRRGAVGGLSVSGFDQNSSQAGNSARLTKAQVFRTSHSGQELPSLPLVAPRIDEFGGLLSQKASKEARGLGTMTARLPNTTQVRDGVHLKKHHVRVVIRDGYARTEVEEEFENSSPHVLEGRYRFPVPGNASLSRLALWVGDQLIEGEVLEKERAANIYSRIVDRPIPRDPALLEWVTGGEMSLKVFPILPKKSRRVLLAYNQALSTENGLLRYVYPLALGEGRETEIKDLSISVHLSDSRAQLRNIRVPNYEAKVKTEGNWQTVMVNLSNAIPSRDFVVTAERASEASAQLSAYVPSWGKSDEKPFADSPIAQLQSGISGHFALRLSADLPEQSQRPPSTPQDRAIVIDVSQSQSKATIAAQGALAYGILREMDPTERYVLLACDSACETFPQRGPATAIPSQLEKARDFLLELTPGGSSDIAGSLVAGATQLKSLGGKGRQRVLVWIGDGKASSGELAADAIARRARSKLEKASVDLRLIGGGRTVDEDALRGLAVELDATFDLLRSGTSLESRIGELAIGLRKPVIHGPRLALPGSLRSEDATKLPALRLGQEIVVTGEILDLSGGEVLLEGSLGSTPYRQVKPIKWKKTSQAQNPLVPRLWARSQLKRLHGLEETPELKAKIIRISRAHRTMSRYTSFLVLESEEMYQDFKVARTTKSKDDQVDSSFSDLRWNEPEAKPEEGESKELKSMEDISTSTEKSRAPRPDVTPTPRPRPAPAPRPASQPKSKPMAPKKGSGSSSRGLGNLGTSGALGGSASGRAIDGKADESMLDPFETEPPLPPPVWRPPPPRRRPRRARITFSQADDAWRKWGDKNLQTLVEKLADDPKSRARHEAYIRGHLQHGRFSEAHRIAREFVKMDPDYSPARELLAYSAIVAGDHELARQMLDVQAETAPRDLAAHAQSARGFEAVGDIVRACAHYRSLAELAPQMEEATTRAEACWAEILDGKRNAIKNDEGQAGQLQVDVQCDAQVSKQDCPAPIVIAPDGTVLSPWTPGTGKSSRTRVSFVKLRTGTYYVLVLGGGPNAKGKVVLTGRNENQAFRFQGGGMHTIAKTEVRFW